MAYDQYRHLLDQVDPDEVTRVCADLVRFNTTDPPGNERPAAEYVAAYLEPAGFKAHFLPYPDEENRASVVCRLSCATGSGRPSLVFNGHLDVVPVGRQEWRYPPFGGVIAEGKVWGRGASDMKGGVASMLVAARMLGEHAVALGGDLLLVATAGEEAGMMGAYQVADWPELGQAGAVIIAEPTGNKMGLAERGVLWVEFSTFGQTAHASTPYQGRNAVTMMRRLLDEVERLDIPYLRHPVLGDFTLSIDTIQGGMVANVVPDFCVATADLRTVPGQDNAAILRQFEQMIADLNRLDPDFRGQVRALYDLPSVDTPESRPAVGRFTAAVEAATGRPSEAATIRFATEASIFVPALHVPAIVFGPGDPDLAHQPEENIAIDKMVEATRVYLAAALEMLG